MSKLLCAECGRQPDERALGWCAYLAVGDEEDPEEEIIVFCLACANREFVRADKDTNR